MSHFKTKFKPNNDFYFRTGKFYTHTHTLIIMIHYFMKFSVSVNKANAAVVVKPEY